MSWSDYPILNPRRGDSQGQEKSLAPSDDNQTGKCNTGCSNHRLSISTLMSNGLNRRKMKW